MTVPLSSVGPGDPLPTGRETWNAMIRAGRHALRGDGAVNAPAFPATQQVPQVTIFVRNDTGGALDAFAVVKLGAPLIDPAAHPHGARQAPVFAGIAPTNYADPFALLVEPAGPGAVARAAVLGVMCCQVTINSTGDAWAGPAGGGAGGVGGTASLVSLTEAGPAKIIYRSSEAGTVTALVLLQGDMGAGPEGSKGPRGPRGPAGEDGEPGEIALPGRRGRDGEPGKRGPAFFAEDGEPGEIGPPGRRGDKGDKGDRGDKGQRGAMLFAEDGVDGDTGVPGKTGAQGPRGLNGHVVIFDSEPGEDGLTIPGKKGATGSSGGGSSPLTTKGDIYIHNGTINTRLPAGTNGLYLIADSTQTAGLRWGTAINAYVTSASQPSVDNRLARYNGTLGLTIDQTTITVADNGSMTIPLTAGLPAGNVLNVDTFTGVVNIGGSSASGGGSTVQYPTRNDLALTVGGYISCGSLFNMTTASGRSANIVHVDEGFGTVVQFNPAISSDIYGMAMRSGTAGSTDGYFRVGQKCALQIVDYATFAVMTGIDSSISTGGSTYKFRKGLLVEKTTP